MSEEVKDKAAGKSAHRKKKGRKVKGARSCSVDNKEPSAVIENRLCFIITQKLVFFYKDGFISHILPMEVV